MWTIIDDRNATTTIEALLEQYPDLVAYDESGWDVDTDDFDADPEGLADAGYATRAARRILFWASEAESKDDSGAHAVAAATWND